jgi:hypothetical protein
MGVPGSETGQCLKEGDLATILTRSLTPPYADLASCKKSGIPSDGGPGGYGSCAPQKYACDATTGTCKADASGTFPSAGACNESCVATKYECTGGSCKEAPSGWHSVDKVPGDLQSASDWQCHLVAISHAPWHEQQQQQQQQQQHPRGRCHIAVFVCSRSKLQVGSSPYKHKSLFKSQAALKLAFGFYT